MSESGQAYPREECHESDSSERRRVGVLLWTPNSYDSMQNDIVLSIECNRIHMSNASESMWGCRKPEIGRLSHLLLFRLKTSKRLPLEIRSRSRGRGRKLHFNLSRQLFPSIGSLFSLSPLLLLRRGTVRLFLGLSTGRRSAEPSRANRLLIQLFVSRFFLRAVESEIWPGPGPGAGLWAWAWAWAWAIPSHPLIQLQMQMFQFAQRRSAAAHTVDANECWPSNQHTHGRSVGRSQPVCSMFYSAFLRRMHALKLSRVLFN
jgi:hypothetical protein